MSRLVQAVEHDDVVEAVHELGLEHALGFFQQLALHVAVRVLFLGGRETEFARLADHVGADVRGHDDHAIAEVHLATERIGQVSVFENLQQHVHDVGVRLFDFVEQHDRVRTATHALGQLAALFVADIARRRTDQPRDIEFLHVLAHVELDQRILVAKHEFRQRAGHQRLAHAGRPEEHERADRPVRVLEVGAAAAQRLADRNRPPRPGR